MGVVGSIKCNVEYGGQHCELHHAHNKLLLTNTVRTSSRELEIELREDLFLLSSSCRPWACEAWPFQSWEPSVISQATISFRKMNPQTSPHIQEEGQRYI